MNIKRNPNTFSVMSDAEIRSVFAGIKNSLVDNIKPRVLPICIMLDLSGSMHDFLEEAKTVIRSICKEFKNSPCDVFLILNTIYLGKVSTVHCDFIDKFDGDEFLRNVKEGYGFTPLIEAFEKADDLTKRLFEALEENKRRYTCPVFIPVTDYIENKHPDIEKIKEKVREIENSMMNKEKMILEFRITAKKAKELKIVGKVNNAISFGGYVTDFEKVSISDLINKLQSASSSVGGGGAQNPPKTDRKAYNEYLTTLLFNRMDALLNRAEC